MRVQLVIEAGKGHRVNRFRVIGTFSSVKEAKAWLHEQMMRRLGRQWVQVIYGPLYWLREDMLIDRHLRGGEVFTTSVRGSRTAARIGHHGFHTRSYIRKEYTFWVVREEWRVK
jgi:hypothetical protein